MNSVKKITALIACSALTMSLAAIPAYAYGEYDSEYVYGEESAGSEAFGDSARRHDGFFSEDAESFLEGKFADGGVMFCWNYLIGADGYVIYARGNDTEKYFPVADIKCAACSYTDRNLKSYSDYIFKMRAYKISDSGEKIFCQSSGEVSVHTEEIVGSSFDTAAESTSESKETVSEFALNTSYEPLSSGSTKEAINNLPLSPRSSFPVISYRDSDEGWTSFVSERDKQILDEFADSHFTSDMTVYDKLKYTAEYIHNNVDYAYDNYDEIAGCSFVEAIFEKHTGQCLQYNGALAAFANYLGLDVRVVAGNRGTGADNKWSHFWCEINLDGRYYVLDAGNKKDGLYYFAEPYETADNYMYFDEVLTVSPTAN